MTVTATYSAAETRLRVAQPVYAVDLDDACAATDERRAIDALVKVSEA